ncbi:response regulator transcription factor [Caldalkalibacillus mannanilyticus]|uniref:response regulator transcription factor n=1 Tax=Caldalkalibacillus mannanilyticus TaxID=1418 RepID=UPI000469D341|nr:response regulator [Caldalkalibacillus mannanilyticus]
MKILLVEDEPMIRRGLCALLQKIELEGEEEKEILEAQNGREAEELLKHHIFDLVFTDIEMPDLDGLALIERWVNHSPYTNWVIISGYDEFHYAQRAISFGVKEYLLKPVTKKKMEETMIRLLASQKKNQFIGADEVEKVLQGLEERVWLIDREAVQRFLNQWFHDIAERNLDLKYYCNLLNHMLDMLLHRLNEKGSQLSEWPLKRMDIHGVNDPNSAFLSNCVELIKIIENKRKGNEKDPIEVAKKFILENLESDVSLEKVAKKLGLNPSYFSQLFKQETSETFVRFRMRARMERAKELLLQSDIRIIDIPSRIGSNDHPHFTKTFKKYTGCSPSEYRAKMGVE